MLLLVFIWVVIGGIACGWDCGVFRDRPRGWRHFISLSNHILPERYKNTNINMHLNSTAICKFTIRHFVSANPIKPQPLWLAFISFMLFSIDHVSRGARGLSNHTHRLLSDKKDYIHIVQSNQNASRGQISALGTLFIPMQQTQPLLEMRLFYPSNHVCVCYKEHTFNTRALWLGCSCFNKGYAIH